ncbi:MAG TPA: ECF-type sigma factor [Bryobacteraceae bacterium]|jgi:RNA polymerase sigma factor (TIGR02999 family)
MADSKAALDDMAVLVYEELRRLARQYLSRERTSHTLQPTALVHEVYLKMLAQYSVDFSNRGQFLGVAASMMRRVLMDHARTRGQAKRTPGLLIDIAETKQAPVDLLDLNRALQQLGALDARQEKIVEMRFFGGMSIDETAEVLGLSPATVNRDWATARLFLSRQMRGDSVADQ